MFVAFLYSLSIFSYKRRLGSFFGVQNFNILFYFRKIYFFFFGGGGGGREDFVGFLGFITNWTIFRGHFYAFKGLFLRSRYRMGDIFRLLNFNIFLWCLKFLISFGGER